MCVGERERGLVFYVLSSLVPLTAYTKGRISWATGTLLQVHLLQDKLNLRLVFHWSCSPRTSQEVSSARRFRMHSRFFFFLSTEPDLTFTTVSEIIIIIIIIVVRFPIVLHFQICNVTPPPFSPTPLPVSTLFVSVMALSVL